MTYNTDIRPGETIEHFYHRIAKVADQRFIRLKQLSKEKGFEGVTEYAYRNAQKSLDVWGGNRFNTKMPESENLRNEKIADMIHFIESKTSTKGGIVNTYEKRAKTLSEKYGLDVKWQDLGKIMEAFQDESSHGSPTKIKALGVINDIKKEGLEAAMKKNRNMNDDIVMTVAKRYLENRDGKYSDLLKSVKAKTSASAILTELEEMGY
jgi:hypothetical protein